jgi:hypothetical protein
MSDKYSVKLTVLFHVIQFCMCISDAQTHKAQIIHARISVQTYVEKSDIFLLNVR